MKRLAGSGAIVFAGVLVGYGATYIYYVSCARALGVEGYGLLSSLLAIVMLGELPASFVTVVIAKTTATLHATGNAGALAAMAQRSSRAAIPLTIAAAALTALGSGALSAFFRIDDAFALWLLAAATTFIAVLPLQRAVLQGTSAFTGYALTTALEGGVRAAVGLSVLAWGGGVRFALAAFVLSGLAAFVADLVFLRRAAPGPAGRGERLHVGDAALTALPIAAITLMTFADVAVVRHALRPYEAGIYGTVSLAGRALITIIRTVPLILLPAAVARAVAGRSSIPLLAAALGAAACAALVVVGFCAWNAPLVVILLGGRAFVGGAPLLVPYAVASSALAFATIIATYLIGIHRTFVGIPLMLIAVAEPITILFFAPDARQAVIVVDIGHCLALTACIVAVVIATLRSAAVARLRSVRTLY